MIPYISYIPAIPPTPARLMCSKLSAVINVLKLGLKVLYCDSDIYVLKDPFKEIPTLDITFQFGGMGDPKMAGAKNFGYESICVVA